MRKCTSTNTLHECLHDFNESSNNITTFKSKQEVSNDSLEHDTESESATNKFDDKDIRISFQESSISKDISCSTFKTALELRNDRNLIASTSNDSRNYFLFDTSILKDDSKDVNAIGRKNKDRNSPVKIDIKNSEEDKAIEHKQLSGFTCARKLHEENNILSKNHLKKSRKSLVKSVKKDSEKKKASPAKKSIYEKILQAASANSKTIVENTTNSSLVEASNSIDSTSLNKDEIKLNSQKKRKSINSFKSSIDVESNKKLKLNEPQVLACDTERITDHNNGVNANETSTNEVIEIEDRKDDIKDVQCEEELSMIKTVEEEILREHKDLQRKQDKIHQSKQQKGEDNKKVLVPADKATQFKTAEILKAHLMKYYPSKRIPDRTTFSKTCREMHYKLLAKKIFGKIDFD